MIKPDQPFIVYRIEGRRSERVAWLCEELGRPYELKFVSGDVSGSLRALRTPGLNSRARFFGGCLWPANFLNRNDSQTQLARWKWPATAMF
jgi:hypothetical protein